jgi:hypothetical protein
MLGRQCPRLLDGLGLRSRRQQLEPVVEVADRQRPLEDAPPDHGRFAAAPDGRQHFGMQPLARTLQVIPRGFQPWQRTLGPVVPQESANEAFFLDRVW